MTRLRRIWIPLLVALVAAGFAIEAGARGAGREVMPWALLGMAATHECVRED